MSSKNTTLVDQDCQLLVSSERRPLIFGVEIANRHKAQTETDR